jgi:uncharacterized membrane protein
LFEAAHSDRCAAPAAEVWALWADPDRWPDWNRQLERVEADGELRVGAELRAKMRRGGTVSFAVVELEPERLLRLEARFPGARLGHEQRLAAGRSSVEITHRVYLDGPLAGFWALMMGRGRLRESVVGFVEREREIAEPPARR